MFIIVILVVNGAAACRRTMFFFIDNIFGVFLAIKKCQLHLLSFTETSCFHRFTGLVYSIVLFILSIQYILVYALHVDQCSIRSFILLLSGVFFYVRSVHVQHEGCQSALDLLSD